MSALTVLVMVALPFVMTYVWTVTNASITSSGGTSLVAVVGRPTLRLPGDAITGPSRLA